MTMKPFDSTYVLDDAQDSSRDDIPVGIGFELDAEHGHITWITREAAMQLFVALAQSFPFHATGTEQAVFVWGKLKRA